MRANFDATAEKLRAEHVAKQQACLLDLTSKENRLRALLAAADRLSHPNTLVQQARRILCATVAGYNRRAELTAISHEAQQVREAKVYRNGAQHPAITDPKELAQLEAAQILCSIGHCLELPETFADWYADANKLLAI